MAVDLTGIVHLLLVSLTDNVFGNMMVTVGVLLIFLVIVAMVIGIPPAFAFAIPIPLSIVLAAYSYVSPIFAAVFSLIFLIMSVASFLVGVGVKA